MDGGFRRPVTAYRRCFKSPRTAKSRRAAQSVQVRQGPGVLDKPAQKQIEKAVGQASVPRLSSLVSANPDALFQLLAVEGYQALEKVFDAAANIKALLSIHNHNV